MNYDKLIETVKVLVNDENVYKKGLTLVYSMDADRHKRLSEHFFYKITGGKNDKYEYTEEFEVEIAEIIIKFVIDDEL
jgi:hypothetical protein